MLFRLKGGCGKNDKLFMMCSLNGKHFPFQKRNALKKKEVNIQINTLMSKNRGGGGGGLMVEINTLVFICSSINHRCTYTRIYGNLF